MLILNPAKTAVSFSGSI
jgi:hypothetical protein